VCELASSLLEHASLHRLTCLARTLYPWTPAENLSAGRRGKTVRGVAGAENKTPQASSKAAGNVSR